MLSVCDIYIDLFVDIIPQGKSKIPQAPPGTGVKEVDTVVTALSY
jgi:hypothetical protein